MASYYQRISSTDRWRICAGSKAAAAKQCKSSSRTNRRASQVAEGVRQQEEEALGRSAIEAQRVRVEAQRVLDEAYAEGVRQQEEEALRRSAIEAQRVRVETRAAELLEESTRRLGDVHMDMRRAPTKDDLKGFDRSVDRSVLMMYDQLGSDLLMNPLSADATVAQKAEFKDKVREEFLVTPADVDRIIQEYKKSMSPR